MSTEQRRAVDEQLRSAPDLAVDDVATVRAQFAELMRGRPMAAGVTVSDSTAGGRPALRFDPTGTQRAGTLLYVHGGGHMIGSPATAQHITAALVARTGLRAVSPDYRLAPEHPFPAAADDVLAVYRELAEQGPVALAGDSAGGNLSLVTALAARDAGLPTPAAVVVFSPGTDATMSGESMRTHVAADPIFAPHHIAAFRRAYLDGHDASDPRVSPLFADLAGLAPTLIQVGGNEILLDDSTRFAVRAAAVGVDVTLDVTGGVPHVFPSMIGALDEADEALDRAALFVSQQLARVA